MCTTAGRLLGCWVQLAYATTTDAVAGQRTENFGDRVADELAAMVEKNTTLAELDIPGIRLGAAGGIKLAKALEKNTTLRNLGLYANSELLSSQDSVVGDAPSTFARDLASKRNRSQDSTATGSKV